ncbi:unnamed protein product [Xylocopa violacea]|uniref:Secreted protein n=1 Tax=Xylocopa violacea TaxID=135666 RepID=A0ABP1N8L1_XYLVO
MIFMAHRLILGLLLNCVEDSRIPRATDACGAISAKSAETVRACLSTVSVTAGGAICWLPAETEPRTVSALLREMAPPRRKQNFWQQVLKYIVKQLIIWSADQERYKYDIHGAQINSWALIKLCRRFKNS